MVEQKQTRQSNLNQFLCQDDLESEEYSSNEGGGQQDNRRKAGTEWTRVKSQDQFNLPRVVTFDYEADLDKFIKSSVFADRCVLRSLDILFEPDSFNKQ